MAKSKGKAGFKQEKGKALPKPPARDEQGEGQDPEIDENDDTEIDLEGFDDSFDRLSNLKERLLEAGYDTAEKIQILLAKKDVNSGEWQHVKTYQHQPPTKDFIAETFRGGEYLLRVKVDDQFVKNMSERFSIPIDIYPPIVISKAPVSGSSGEAMLAQTLGQLISKLDDNSKSVQTQIAEQQKNTMDLFMKMIEVNKTPQVDEVDKFKQIVMLFELLDKRKGNKEDVNYGEMFKTFANQTLGFTFDMLREEQERKSGSGIVEKVVDKIGNLLDGVNLKNLVAGASMPKPVAPTPQSNNQSQQQLNAPQTNAIQQSADQTNLLLSWFMSQVIIAQQKGHDVMFLADSVMLIDNFKQLRDIIASAKNEEIITFLSQSDYAVYFNDPDFKAYFNELLDTIRDYDKLNAEDDEEDEENSDKDGDGNDNKEPERNNNSDKSGQ